MKQGLNFKEISNRTIIRSFLRQLGRLVIPLLFKIEINGREKFPKKGPLIVVGNHTAIMETVLLICFTPWHIDMLGAADIPHEKITALFSNLFGFIPVNRGHIDRTALRSALEVLEKDGILGIFPEGGIWEPGLMKAQTGVAWLSYRGQAPVLPIGFSGTLGALKNAFRLKRPKLIMAIGDIIPPLEIKLGIARKTLFEEFSEQVMVAVRTLLLPDEPSIQEKIKNEQFELKLTAWDGKEPIHIPQNLEITHDTALVQFLHRPAILKIFRSNLKLPISPLENIKDQDDPAVILEAVNLILDYLKKENPYLLSYRFGPKKAEEMLIGLQDLSNLLNWAGDLQLKIQITPIRRFFSVDEGKEVVQTEQGLFKGWM